MAVNNRELEKAERLIEQIELNYRHPAMDPKHPNYKQAANALNQLKSKVAESRAALEAERHFTF